MRSPSRRHRVVVAWAKRHKTKLYALLGVVLLGVIMWQLAVPANNGLPFAVVDDEAVAKKSSDEIAALVQKKFQDATVTIKAGDKEERIPLKNLGANPNTDTMIEPIVTYPLWQRLIPFSILLRQHTVRQLNVYFDNEQLTDSIKKISASLKKPPTNAGIAIKDGNVVIKQAQPGYEVLQKELQVALSDRTYNFGNSDVEAKTKELAPARIDEDIVSVTSLAERTLNKKITLKGPDNATYQPTRKQIAAWLTVNRNAKNELVVAANNDALLKYARAINDKVKIDPGVTMLRLLDGEEADRQNGSEGREVIIDELVNALKAAVTSDLDAQQITIMTKPVTSVIVSDRQYSSSQKGLQAYVDYVTSAEDIRVSLVQLDGERWAAQAREHESTPAASTFKVYVAMVLFDEMKRGAITWNDPMLDTTVAGCFERMTVASTNPCAESWLASFGREHINSFIYSRGFSHGTTFTPGGGPTVTTAADLTKFMIGLHTGTLVNGEYRDRLLDSLGRHPYGYGVPTGSAGIVHDKVGFLWDYVHDAAIVQHPRGTYVVTIMTKGQSYARIAQITRELERIMYP